MLIRLLDWLSGHNAVLAMLCKTSVARKVLAYAWRSGSQVQSASMHLIDAQASFGVSVDACLLARTIHERMSRSERRRIFVTWLASARPEAVFLCPGNGEFSICTQVVYTSVNNRYEGGMNYHPVSSLPALSTASLVSRTLFVQVSRTQELHTPVSRHPGRETSLAGETISCGRFPRLLHRP